MILAAILTLFQALLIDVVIFYVGKILADPEQLRKFLGLNQDEDQSGYHTISFWVERMGKVVQIIAMISAITSLVTTLTIVSGL